MIKNGWTFGPQPPVVLANDQPARQSLGNYNQGYSMYGPQSAQPSTLSNVPTGAFTIFTTQNAPYIILLALIIIIVIAAA